MSAIKQAEWRILLSEPASGPENMALDDVLLTSAEGGKNAVTLRLYAWDPPCLSIGYAQTIGQVDLQALDRLGWDLVRRPTGGTAILHTDEITYSICGSAHDPLFDGGVLRSYRRVSRAILSALQDLGLPARTESTDVPRHVPANGRNPICFQDPGPFEIKAGNRKLVGSAQVRRRGGVLQHGSLPLTGDIAKICLGLSYADRIQREQAMRAVRQEAVTLEGALGRRVTWEAAAGALRAGFEREFLVGFSIREVSRQEVNRSRELLETRYSHPDWTRRI